MNNKLTTPKAILIGSFMIAGTILYTSENISNPIIRTAHATSHQIHQLNLLNDIRNILNEIGRMTCLQTYSVEDKSFYANLKNCKKISEEIRELEKLN